MTDPLAHANRPRLSPIRGFVRGATAGIVVAFVIFAPAILVGAW